MWSKNQPSRNPKRPIVRVLLVAAGLWGLVALGLPARALALDAWLDDFENATLDATVNGVNGWSVTAGATTNAVVQSAVTASGTGKALKITGVATPVTVSRSATYGGITPVWVRMLVHPGLGSERRANPSSGVAAVTFDYTGKILAADGTNWVDTGKTFSTDDWWEIWYKLNFTTKTYDLYLQLAGTSTNFIPVKSGLGFIDTSKTGLSALTLGGAYSTTLPSTMYVDDVSVTYVEGAKFISAAQTLVQDQPSGPITVQLQNSVSEAQTATADVTLELKSTSGGGKFSLQREPWKDVAQVTLPKNANAVSFYYKDSKAGKPMLSVKEYPDHGWTEGLQQQQVVSKFAHFEVLATSPQTAGTAFPLTIYARDSEGNSDETYGGTVALTVTYVDPTGGTKVLVPAEAGGFSKGRLDLTVTYADAGSIQIVATDKADESKAGSSGTVLMLPATLTVDAEATQVVSRAFPLTVTALNAVGAVTPNYQGPVTLGLQAVTPATGSGALSPTTVATGSFQSGKASVTATYPRWGTILVTATDGTSPAITGASSPLTFQPASLQLALSSPPAPRDFFYTGETFTATASLLDAAGVTIPNYQGAIELSAPSALGLPASYPFVATDAGHHVFTTSSGSPGTYTVSAKEPAAALTSPSPSVTVKQAMLQVISTVASVGNAAEVTILLLDDQGKVITSENTATITVKLVEDNPNQSVSSSALTQPIKLVNGRGTLLLADSEAEGVTVIPTSGLGFRVSSGTVSFGRYATKGIGVLLWREVREPRGEAAP